MIKQIYGSKYVIVAGGLPMTPYISPGSVAAGHVRYNGNTNELEINDGVTWKSIGSAAPTIELSEEAQEILSWAKEEMKRQVRIRTLAAQYPMIAELQSKLDVMVELLDKHEVSK